MELLQDQHSLYIVNDAGERREIPPKTVIEYRARFQRTGLLTQLEMQELWDAVQNQQLAGPVGAFWCETHGWRVVDPCDVCSTRQPKHPAKFSNGFIDIFRSLLQQHLYTPWKYPEPLIFDPFAGVGTIHQLRPEFMTYGYEIEPEWAAASEFTICGDSTNLPAAWNNTFAAVVTSPTYGNRMADHHEPGKCSECGGDGFLRVEVTTLGDTSPQFVQEQCPKCDGAGVENSKRNTYRHTLGRPLSDNNTGQFQYSQARYYELHQVVYEQCWRVIEPDGLMIVNVSNHIRQGKEVNVCSMHQQILKDIGFTLITRQPVETQRNGFGQNGQLRVNHEMIYVYRKVL